MPIAEPRRRPTRPRFSLCEPVPEGQPAKNRSRWAVNGFPALVEVWSADEWDRLDPKPAGVQLMADGSRVGLRFE